MTFPPAPAGLPDALRDLDRTVVMGVLNVTPDSFSDGGRFLAADAAVAHGLALYAAGADLVDVGGESTRPGRRADRRRRGAAAGCCRSSRRWPAAGVPVSIDTTRASVAVAALERGAVLVNDVSGGLADPAMLPLVARARLHVRGDALARAVHGDGAAAPRTTTWCATCAASWPTGSRPPWPPASTRRSSSSTPGSASPRTATTTGALLAQLDVLQGLGRPLLVGASRKRFLGSLLADADGTPPPTAERDDATAAVSALAAAAGRLVRAGARAGRRAWTPSGSARAWRGGGR